MEIKSADFEDEFSLFELFFFGFPCCPGVALFPQPFSINKQKNRLCGTVKSRKEDFDVEKYASLKTNIDSKAFFHLSF